MTRTQMLPTPITPPGTLGHHHIVIHLLPISQADFQWYTKKFTENEKEYSDLQRFEVTSLMPVLFLSPITPHCVYFHVILNLPVMHIFQENERKRQWVLNFFLGSASFFSKISIWFHLNLHDPNTVWYIEMEDVNKSQN